MRCVACDRLLFDTEDPDKLCGICTKKSILADVVVDKTKSYAFEGITNDLYFDPNSGVTFKRID